MFLKNNFAQLTFSLFKVVWYWFDEKQIFNTKFFFFHESLTEKGSFQENHLYMYHLPETKYYI